MKRVIRSEEDLLDRAVIRSRKPGVARRMRMQITQPLNARFFLPQAIEEVGLELVVARAAAILVLGTRARWNDMRNLESFAADEAEDCHGKFQLSIEVRKPHDLVEDAVLQRQGFHARWSFK